MLIVLQLAAANILLAIISYETLNFPVEMTNQKTVEFIPFWKKSFHFKTIYWFYEVILQI